MPMQLKQRQVPVNLRQSGKPNLRMLVGTRVRKSPYLHGSSTGRRATARPALCS